MRSDRRPASLLPAPEARLAVLALLGGVGALEWARMVEGLARTRALSWVLAALVAGALVVAAGRAGRRLRGPLAAAAAVAALLGAFLLAGLDAGLLRPARWPELGEGLARGMEALGGVRLPYRGEDVWPALSLQLLGAMLCVVAALLAVWPGGGRGHQILALVALLTLVVSPVVALGGPKPLVFGTAVALLTAAFLWLERVPVRPGPSVAALLAVTLAVALPLGAAADREEPWFDYRAFAESLGPSDPIRFSWDHDYGPIDWGRDGVELFRVRAAEPMYWKADTLATFDGERWVTSHRPDPDGERPEDDLPPDWRERRGWTERFQVTLRRLRTSTVVGAGTIIDVEGASRDVRPDFSPGRWVAERPLGRGESYSVLAHLPRPAPELLAGATTGAAGQQRDNLRVIAPFRPDAIEAISAGGTPLGPPSAEFPEGIPLEEAEVEFRPYGQPGRPQAQYRRFGLEGDGTDAIRRSTLVRAWRLARRLKEGTASPFGFVLRVNSFLRDGAFEYSELPAADGSPVGLERFLFETRRGYCQHFSGAMALLLRMGGVPARVATGFTPGGFRKRRGEWIVRDTDAHSWVEVWFDGIGWVTFDPTPPATPARSQVAALEPGDLPEALRPEPTQDAEDPTARRPEGLLRDAEPGGGQSVASQPGNGAGGGGLPSPQWLLLALIVLAPALWWRLRRGRRGHGARSTQDAVAELERALRRAGRPLENGVTLAQLERRLGTSTYLKALRAARYGAAPAPSPRDRAAFRRELASGLGWAGSVRAWWALPPRWLQRPRLPLPRGPRSSAG